MKALIALAAASLVALAACGGGQAATASGGTVAATLSTSQITLDKTTVKAGLVTFVVKNTAADAHELVIIKTDVAQDKLAASTTDAGKVSEDGSLGESGTLEKDGYNTFSLTLAPGKYVLICNEVGHYGMGMHVAFIVTN